MLTGTPLDLTPFGEWLRALGLAYWVFAAFLVALALWRPKRWWVKFSLAGALVTTLSYPLWASRTPVVDPRIQQARARLAESMDLFAERCKTAGEKIARTVDGVDGIVWMKWREPYSGRDNFADQFKLNDPYGRDCGEEHCIVDLLRVTGGADLKPEEARRYRVGYSFLETVDPKDGQTYRYRSVIKSIHKRTEEEKVAYKRNTGQEATDDVYGRGLVREAISSVTARYGVVWDDISTREEREHWVAGSSLKVIDLRTNEVIGERIGYMVDRGQGSEAGFRSPWLEAVQTACPVFPTERGDSRHGRTLHETRDFVNKVVKPTQGE